MELPTHIKNTVTIKYAKFESDFIIIFIIFDISKWSQFHCPASCDIVTRGREGVHYSLFHLLLPIEILRFLLYCIDLHQIKSCYMHFRPSGDYPTKDLSVDSCSICIFLLELYFYTKFRTCIL